MAKFRKKPIEVEAFRLVDQEVIETLEGTMIGNPGDWLITGVAGERYPCKHEIFMQTYEPADNCKCPRGISSCPGAYEEDGCWCPGDCDSICGILWRKASKLVVENRKVD